MITACALPVTRNASRTEALDAGNAWRCVSPRSCCSSSACCGSVAGAAPSWRLVAGAQGVPLLLPLRGVLRGDTKSMQWALLLVLAVRRWKVRARVRPAPYGTMAMIELLLGLVFFVAAIVYLRPFKRAAKARAAKRQDDLIDTLRDASAQPTC
jgi:uncharacterized membrane protein